MRLILIHPSLHFSFHNYWHNPCEIGSGRNKYIKVGLIGIIKTSSMFDIARVIYDSSDGLMLHHMNYLVHSRVCFPGSQPNRRCTQIFAEGFCKMNPDSKVHGANMGPTWVLPVPDGPHDGPMNLAIREIFRFYLLWRYWVTFMPWLGQAESHHGTCRSSSHIYQIYRLMHQSIWVNLVR